MSYGQDLPRLSPLEPAQVAHTLTRFCPPPARLLDVGCGRGLTMSWLQQNTAYLVQGLEADPAYAAACGATLGRAEALPFADDSFDAALLECVFSLLDQPELAAAEIARVLRPGGVLLLADLYARQGQADFDDNRLLRHIYAAEGIRRLIGSVGLQQLDFIDHSWSLQSLLAQMIMDGTACDCLDDDCRRQLKQVRAGYGLWVFGREDADAGL